MLSHFLCMCVHSLQWARNNWLFKNIETAYSCEVDRKPWHSSGILPFFFINLKLFLVGFHLLFLRLHSEMKRKYLIYKASIHLFLSGAHNSENEVCLQYPSRKGMYCLALQEANCFKERKETYILGIFSTWLPEGPWRYQGIYMIKTLLWESLF